MSFLPDLAGWALSGGAGRNNNGDDENQNEHDNNNEPMQQESEEEIRAKRIARLAARFEDKSNNNQPTSSATGAVKSNDDSMSNVNVDLGNGQSTMQVDNEEDIAIKSDKNEDKKLLSSMEETRKEVVSSNTASTGEPLTKKKRDIEPVSPSKLDPTQKLHRKREMLIKKILNIRLTGGNTISEGCIELDIGSSTVTEENIAEILALRLDMPESALQSASPMDRNLIAYLASCHKKVTEELKNSKPDSIKGHEQFLKEIQNQVVSFAASSLLAPDLFTLGKDCVSQLAVCLSRASLDPTASITLGIGGKKSSFYACLCEELCNQDPAVFESVIKGVVTHISDSLSKCDTILDSANGSGLEHVAALTSVCSVKKAAAVMSKVPNFLLPPIDSPKAKEKISTPIPPPPAGATPQQQSIYRMMAAMSQGTQGYLGRSGPALEKKTLLGLVMRLGTPMDSASITSQFQNVASRSRADVKKTTENLRRQLKNYQESIYTLVKALITAGEEARKPVSTALFR